MGLKFLILLGLLWVINYLLNFVSWNYSVSLPFECGFENQSWGFMSLSLHYVKVILIFILFDLELLYLLGMYFLMSFFFVFILLLILWATWLCEMYLATLNWLI